MSSQGLCDELFGYSSPRNRRSCQPDDGRHIDLGREKLGILGTVQSRLKLRIRPPPFQWRPAARGRVDTELALPVCLYASIRENHRLRVELMKWRPGTPLLMAGADQSRRASGKSWARFRPDTVRDQMTDRCPCHAHIVQSSKGPGCMGMHAVGGMAVISSRRAKLQQDKLLGPDLTPAGPPQAYCIVEPSGPNDRMEMRPGCDPAAG